MCIYLVIVAGGFLVLLTTDAEVPADRLLFLSVSAVGNVGLSHDRVSIVGPGLYVLSLMMLVMGVAPGRAEVKEVWVGASGMTCGT